MCDVDERTTGRRSFWLNMRRQQMYDIKETRGIQVIEAIALT